MNRFLGLLLGFGLTVLVTLLALAVIRRFALGRKLSGLPAPSPSGSRPVVEAV